MNQTPKVSILVPVYNTSHFLPQCLNSLISQTLKDIQIICINDGSTDESLSILEDFARRDSRIEIISKENSGYGASMNRGLDVARGEYVGITESDDFASPKMFAKLYKFASKHNCDLVKSNYFEYLNGSDIKQKPFDGFPYRTVFNPSDMQDAIKALPIIWAGLYRRSMLESCNIRFNETPGASFQDTSFVHKVWFTAERVALLKGCYLHYRVDNENSSVKSTAKVYEVCGEFALSEAYLREDPKKFEVFAPLLNVMKLNAYRWNYNRISIECRQGFIEKWSEEFRAAQTDGVLRRDCFDEYNWGIVCELVDDPGQFFSKYKEAL